VRKEKHIDKFILSTFVFAIAFAVGIAFYYSAPAEKEAQLSASLVSASGYQEELEMAEEAAAAEEAEEAASDEEKVRTTPWNVFNIPVDTSGVYFDFSYTKDPFKKVRVGFHTIPSPMTEKEFDALKTFSENLIGIPYAVGGDNPESGFDCSGFVQYVLLNCGHQMEGRSCEAQLEFCCEISESQIMPGDLVFFKGTQERESVSHVGLYLGDGQMIHAGLGGIQIVSLSEKYWVDHFYSYARPLY